YRKRFAHALLPATPDAAVMQDKIGLAPDCHSPPLPRPLRAPAIPARRLTGRTAPRLRASRQDLYGSSLSCSMSGFASTRPGTPSSRLTVEACEELGQFAFGKIPCEF